AEGIASIAFFAIYWVLNSAIDLINAVYVERQKLAYDAAVNLGHRALGALLGIVLVLEFRNVFVVAISYASAAAVSLIVTSAIVFWKFNIRPFPSLGTGRVRHLFFEAVPLMFAMFFSFVYFHMDVLMLKGLTTDEIAGWYVAAFRILEFTMLLPGAAAMVIMPYFATQFTKDKDNLVIVSGNLVRLLFATGFFISFILVTLAGRMISLFGKDFGADSEMALQILIWTVPLIYVDYVLIYLLVASGRQKKNVVAAAFCTLLNVVLNYALIPVLSYKGAAIATIITQVLLMAMSARFVRDPLPTFRMLRYISRVAPAGLLGAVAFWFVRGWTPEIACLLTLAVFVVGLLVFKGIERNDMGLLRKLIARRDANLSAD
ncbi:MAG: polysaccharide biosynthesis C-terminal domain-containing protein, partial [Candidatus Coatesbacteria bacterium]|nr:polysaccharide biosynthesis C-terminal domain-containing protein [Candidatus Coatesbacteria bacterium]